MNPRGLPLDAIDTGLEIVGLCPPQLPKPSGLSKDANKKQSFESAVHSRGDARALLA
jgi:hypothetical protein